MVVVDNGVGITEGETAVVQVAKQLKYVLWSLCPSQWPVAVDKGG